MLNKNESNLAPSCRLCKKKQYTPIYYLDEIAIVRCSHCDFIQIGKAHALEDLKKHYILPNNLREESNFERNKIIRTARFRANYVIKHTGLKAGNVLEVGSSYGHFLHKLKDQGFKVLGIEPSSSGALKTQEKGVSVINDLLENTDLPNSHFDAICMFQVIEHFENPEDVLRVLHSKIKKGGYLILETPNIYSIGAKFEKTPHKLFNKEHITYFSPKNLTDLLMPLGFSKIAVHHCDYDGFRMPFMKSIKKIATSLTNPNLKGPLGKILTKEIDIHYNSLNLE